MGLVELSPKFAVPVLPNFFIFFRIFWIINFGYHILAYMMGQGLYTLSLVEAHGMTKSLNHSYRQLIVFKLSLSHISVLTVSSEELSEFNSLLPRKPNIFYRRWQIRLQLPCESSIFQSKFIIRNVFVYCIIYSSHSVFFGLLTLLIFGSITGGPVGFLSAKILLRNFGTPL